MREEDLLVPDDLLRILRDPLLWAPPPVELFISREQIAAIFAEADAEEKHAIAVCDRLLSGASAAWWERFRRTPESRTPGVVRQLLARVPALFDRRPADAREATSIAMAIAETLDPQKFPTDYVVMVRAEALRDHAFVLTLLGRHAEALTFVERAERTFAQIEPVYLDSAHVVLARAVVLAALHRRERVPELLRTAKEIYADNKDQHRYEEVCLAEPALVAEAPDASAMREAALRLLRLRA